MGANSFGRSRVIAYTDNESYIESNRYKSGLSRTYRIRRAYHNTRNNPLPILNPLLKFLVFNYCTKRKLMQQLKSFD